MSASSEWHEGAVALGTIVTQDAVQTAKQMVPTLEHVHTQGVDYLIRYDSPEPYTSAMKACVAGRR